MGRHIILSLLLLICFKAYSAENLDSLLNVLDKNIEMSDSFLLKKRSRIDNYTILLNRTGKLLPEEQKFTLYSNLFNEYESFIYDSAFKYAEKMRNSADKLKDNPRIALSKIKICFTLLSSGLFKEALDTLNSINPKNLPDSILVDYYSVYARTYFDLADYDKDIRFQAPYHHIGNRYIDSALNYLENNSLTYQSLLCLKKMKQDDMFEAQKAFEKLLENYQMPHHQYAINASSLGYIYSLQGQTEKAIAMLIKAAIADIQSSTKETVALRNLSDLLFKNGDLKKSYKFIKMAMNDATFYNARHRKIEIATILPIIEGEQLNTVEKQRSLLLIYSALITLLIILVVVFLAIIFRQLKKLKAAKQIIQETNMSLTETNNKLMEANKIKEEYIGYFFTINSEYLDKIEKFQKEVNRKLATGRIDDIKNIIKNIDLKREREELYYSFDKIFLKLFPDFVKTFNSYFKDEDKIVLKDNELLNTDLRIFALIRMGISDNEKIAKILEYSVNTIYTYKTKIKNKSLVPNELFESKINEIKTV